MKKLLIGVLFITVCFLLVGCGKGNKSKNPIVGKWAYSSNFVYTFNEDKTCEYNAAGTIMKCTYEIDGDNISILYEGNTIASSYEYKIKGKKLIIKDSLGNDVTYIRK